MASQIQKSLVAIAAPRLKWIARVRRFGDLEGLYAMRGQARSRHKSASDDYPEYGHGKVGSSCLSLPRCQAAARR